MTPIQELAKRGGAVPASEWNTGHPTFAKRPIPAHCCEVVAKDLSTIPLRSRAACQAVLDRRPRVRSLVVIRNWDAVNPTTVSP